MPNFEILLIVFIQRCDYFVSPVSYNKDDGYSQRVGRLPTSNGI